jgi:hypothetical protein
VCQETTAHQAEPTSGTALPGGGRKPESHHKQARRMAIKPILQSLFFSLFFDIKQKFPDQIPIIIKTNPYLPCSA